MIFTVNNLVKDLLTTTFSDLISASFNRLTSKPYIQDVMQLLTHSFTGPLDRRRVIHSITHSFIHSYSFKIVVRTQLNIVRQESKRQVKIQQYSEYNKKLSHRRETARQLPTWREGGVRPSSPLRLRPLWLYLCVWLNLKATTSVRQACRP